MAARLAWQLRRGEREQGMKEGMNRQMDALLSKRPLSSSDYIISGFAMNQSLSQFFVHLCWTLPLTSLFPRFLWACTGSFPDLSVLFPRLNTSLSWSPSWLLLHVCSAVEFSLLFSLSLVIWANDQ